MRIEKRAAPEYGVTLNGVWIPYSFLEELEDQDPFMSDFGRALLAPRQDVKEVCEAWGLLRVETRGGVCRGPKLREFLKELEWPERD